MADLTLRDATVFDGTGAEPFRADVSIDGDRIAALDAVGGAPARTGHEVDLAGAAVSPGFIDVHTHDDFAVVLYPDVAFKVEQGVTTVVVGNCGMGAAPWPTASLFARAFHPGATSPEWQGYAGYLAHLDRHAPAVNVAALVGHGAVRGEVMRLDDRPPTSSEMAAMRALVEEGLDAGAFGLSAGLVYQPGCFAATDELTELASLSADRGGIYTSHIRNESDLLLEAMGEAVEIGERAGVRVQVSHHKASGRANWGRVHDSLALLDAARERGVDVGTDAYPYTAGSTILAAVVQNGGFDDSGGSGGLGRVDGSDIVIGSASEHPEREGHSIADLAAHWGVGEAEAAARVLSDDPGATVIMHSMDEADVRTVLAHPRTMIGSDGIPTLEGKPHPRLFGTFPRVLGHYARDLGVLTMADAVHRMTGLSAATFNLTDRGVIREGAFADLVVFDPNTVIDRATYEEPHLRAAGIRAVYVNGVETVTNGAVRADARAGRALRHSPG